MDHLLLNAKLARYHKAKLDMYRYAPGETPWDQEAYSEAVGAIIDTTTGILDLGVESYTYLALEGVYLVVGRDGRRAVKRLVPAQNRVGYRVG